MFKGSNAYLIMRKTINNDIIRKVCRRVYNTVSPFMKEARGIQWNNFRYRYAVFSLYRSWGGFAFLYAAVPYAFCSSLKRNNACSVIIQYCAVSRFHFLPVFFLATSLISRASLLFGAMYFHIYIYINIDSFFCKY